MRNFISKGKADIAIQTENLVKYYADKLALSATNLKLEFNKIHCIIGRNGSGKSTLIKLLCNSEQPSQGKLTLASHAHIGYVSNELSYPNYITLNNVSQLFSSSEKTWDNDRFLHILSIFDLALDSKFSSLSTGEKAGAKIAIMIAQKPNIWLLDEATLGIDIVAQGFCLTALLEYFIIDQPCVLLCTHQISEIERLAEEVIIMQNGKIKWQGNKDALIEPETNLSASIYALFTSSLGEVA